MRSNWLAGNQQSKIRAGAVDVEKANDLSSRLRFAQSRKEKAIALESTTYLFCLNRINQPPLISPMNRNVFTVNIKNPVRLPYRL
ncbi:hypothetical protein, partial [Funiculus sociatus]|uniref:hypothetical protein n=1 Tax=Funiculus sociatus TaxID=450527 RepID=UPI0016879BA4